MSKMDSFTTRQASPKMIFGSQSQQSHPEEGGTTDGDYVSVLHIYVIY